MVSVNFFCGFTVNNYRDRRYLLLDYSVRMIAIDTFIFKTRIYAYLFILGR